MLADGADHVVALDKSLDMLRLARARLQRFPAERVEIVPGDFAALPFAAASFDTVTLHQVLHFALDPAAALAEAARVLAPGGRVAVVDFAPHEREGAARAAPARAPRFSDGAMAGLLERAGFSPAASEALGGELTVRIWTGEARTQGHQARRHQARRSQARCHQEGSSMNVHSPLAALDPAHEARTAHDTPLFAGLPGDVTASFEFFPPKTDKMEEKLWEAVQELKPLAPEFVSVTYGAGGSTRERTHNTVARIIAEAGLPAAAHLTCVDASRGETREIAARYWEAGVRHIVALRGDAGEPGAPFVAHEDGYANAAELVAGLREVADFEISVAAYPETHPDADCPQSDIDHLKRKLDAGATRAISQFCFSAETFFRFRDRLAAAGVEAEVVPGILPVTNVAQARKFAGACGAAIPDWMDGLFDGLDERPASRNLVAATVAAEFCRKLYAGGERHFHFYTLNRADLAYGDLPSARDARPETADDPARAIAGRSRQARAVEGRALRHRDPELQAGRGGLRRLARHRVRSEGQQRHPRADQARGARSHHPRLSRRRGRHRGDHTFSSNRISQADYGAQDLVRELNVESARIARRAADAAAGDGRPRFVAGAIGPTTRPCP